MRLTVVGSGDAFGSGGRANTCFWLEHAGATVAVDFGATSLVALKRLGLDPNCLDAIILSHLHGDHFGGLPFLLLDRQFSGPGPRALTIVGPEGTRARLDAAMEVFFPGSTSNTWRFPLHVVDLPCEAPHALCGLDLKAVEVVHPSGAPSTALRIAGGGRVLAYSGDTSWTEALLQVSTGADLFILECYRLAGAPVAHLDLQTIERQRPRFGAGRVMLTHMSAEVLARVAEIEARGYLAAHDGLVLDV